MPELKVAGLFLPYPKVEYSDLVLTLESQISKAEKDGVVDIYMIQSYVKTVIQVFVPREMKSRMLNV